MHKKWTSLSDYTYPIPTLQCKVCLMSTKVGQFTVSDKTMEKYVK